VTGTENSFWNFPSFTVTDQLEMGSRNSVVLVVTTFRAMTNACSRACLRSRSCFPLITAIMVTSAAVLASELLVRIWDYF
jgi:hypothetical protein